MKKLLLLAFLCVLSVNLFAQSHEKSFGLNDTTMLTLPHATLFKTPNSLSFRSLNVSVDNEFFKQKGGPHKQLGPMPVYPRIVILRPLRVVIRQKYVRYGSQIVFWEPPQVTIYPTRIIYK
jgi:hypothetical protein